MNKVSKYDKLKSPMARREIDNHLNTLKGEDEDRFEKVFDDKSSLLSGFFEAAEEWKRNGIVDDHRPFCKNGKRKRNESEKSQVDEVDEVDDEDDENDVEDDVEDESEDESEAEESEEEDIEENVDGGEYELHTHYDDGMQQQQDQQQQGYYWR